MATVNPPTNAAITAGFSSAAISAVFVGDVSSGSVQFGPIAGLLHCEQRSTESVRCVEEFTAFDEPRRCRARYTGRAVRSRGSRPSACTAACTQTAAWIARSPPMNRELRSLCNLRSLPACSQDHTRTGRSQHPLCDTRNTPSTRTGCSGSRRKLSKLPKTHEAIRMKWKCLCVCHSSSMR